MMATESESAIQSDAILDKHLDQQGAGVAVAAAETERDRTGATAMSTTPTPSFRFNFTSERFKAAVKAACSAEKDGSLEVHPVMEPIDLSISASASTAAAADDMSPKSMPSPAASVQKSAACVELERVPAVVQEELGKRDIEGQVLLRIEDSPSVANADDEQGRDATAAVVGVNATTSIHPVAPLLSTLTPSKDESDAIATAEADDAVAAATNLAGILSMSTAPRSMSSLSITADFIQKSAPMSPLTSITPKHKNQIAQRRGQDQTRGSSGLSRRESSVSVPTSPESLSTGSGTATQKVMGWRPLQRLMRKMTKNSNESMKPSMPHGGRMHLEGS
ncbi:hypothetical protein BGZ72_002551 [Mortierella alpina]|nr:hypothetical protein BGZ72_002551 [Mortierella alpina]